jgi:alkyldihydroxyacetonephosphate synthase
VTDVFDATRSALIAAPHTRAASCHLSHSYADGACLYFTFAATPPPDEVEATYVALWDAGQRAVLANGGNLSHHHGVGLNRARFMADALGPQLAVLQAVKDALDPTGILNPGKLALRHPFDPVRWP